MREYLGLEFQMTTIIMLRADLEGAIWLTEDDIEGRFYEKFAHTEARVIPTQGLAVRLLQQVRAGGVSGVIAVTRGQARAEDLTEGLFIPDLGDVASILFKSGCWSSVVKEIVGSPWLTAAEKQLGSVRDRIVAIAWMVSQIPGCSDVPIDKIIDWEEFQPSIAKLCSTYGAEICARVEEVWAAASRIDSKKMLSSVDGMVAATVFAAALRHFRPRGLSPRQVKDAVDILSLLTVAFDLAEFESDQMYRKMRRWEQRNPKYPLLRRWRTLDPLGVILDQRYWEQDLKELLRSNDGLIAFKLDLDNFKPINDELGHAHGDEAMRIFFKIVNSVLGSVGEVYRRGGDEVVAFAPGLNEAEGCALAETLRSTVEGRMRQWADSIGFDKFQTASIGVVYVPFGTSDEAVVSMLDEAQKQAKHGGKNRVVFLRCGQMKI